MPIVHEVKGAECLASIAAQVGLADPDVIYSHPENAALRDARPNWNVLNRGDRVTIPDREVGEVEVPSGKAHTFLVKRPKVEVVVRILTDRDEPLADAPYLLSMEGSDVEGKTDGDGFVRASVDVALTAVDLYLWAEDPGAEVPSDAFRLELGALPPPSEVEGAQSRLQNLGYFVGAVDGEHGPRTTHAVKAYQAKKGLPITGDLDDDTQHALEQDHGA